MYFITIWCSDKHTYFDDVYHCHGKIQLTFPNIHFAINCNNPVRFLSDNSQCSPHRSDLIIIQSVWNDMKKLRQTKSTINGKMNVWKCKLIFPTDTLQQKIEITDVCGAPIAKSVHKAQNSQRHPWPPLYIIRGNVF